MIESPCGAGREAERMRALLSTHLLDTPPDEAFDRLTRLATLMFDTPIALVSLVDADRQWFKSRQGLKTEETPRSISFCSRAIESEEVLVVEDALLDPRFAQSPLVTGDPFIRFYAGAPLRVGGYAIGSLCVIDRKPRHFGQREVAQLQALGEAVVAQIELHRKAGRINDATRLPNRAQMAEDIDARAEADPTGRCALLLVELISHRRLHETMLAVGMAPMEDGLRSIAAVLRKQLGPAKPLYHVSEARLCVALPEGTRVERETFARGLIEELSKPFDAVGVLTQVRPVAGLAEFELSQGAAEALRMATSALMQARARGERLRWRDDAVDAAHRRAYALMQAVPGGLARGEFRLVYQPKYDLREGGFTGVEALARWRHATLGDVSPGEFIPLIERTALIHDFTPWVLREALAQSAAWSAEGLDLSVAVNVSSRNLDAEGFVEQAWRIIAGSGLQPSRLHVECTENAVMTSEATRSALAALRGLGCHISLDDFGMGYSNLACLRDLPIQTLKIDQSLIKPMELQVRARKLVRSLIGMGHALGFQVLAEGVETQAARAMLVEDGCDALQGYLLARPMEAAAVTGFLANRMSA